MKICVWAKRPQGGKFWVPTQKRELKSWAKFFGAASSYKGSPGHTFANQRFVKREASQKCEIPGKRGRTPRGQIKPQISLWENPIWAQPTSEPTTTKHEHTPNTGGTQIPHTRVHEEKIGHNTPNFTTKHRYTTKQHFPLQQQVQPQKHQMLPTNQVLLK